MENKNNWPRITIVTPSFNQGKFLEETIQSVLNQNYPNLEYFIVDGGSTDISVEIIKKYENKIDWWVSEPDKGQSDALNKGFQKATGDYLTWVNSDDILFPGALNLVSAAIMRNPGLQWISGDLIWIDENGLIIHCSHLLGYKRVFASLGLLVVGGPSTFFSRSLFESVGEFDLNLVYTMDSDLWWRFHIKGTSHHHISKYLMAFRFHSESKCSAISFLKNNNPQKQAFLLKEKRKKEESARLRENYGHWAFLLWAKLFYKSTQILNGNYLRAWKELQKMRGQSWKQFFPNKT